MNCGARKTFESPLDCKEIRPVNPKGNQPWIFIARTDSETEVPIFWPPDANSQLIGKDPHAGKDWRQEEKETTEDQMVGWHHQPDGHEFQHTLGGGEGKERLTCCSPWGHKDSDTTEQLNNNRYWQTQVVSISFTNYHGMNMFLHTLYLLVCLWDTFLEVEFLR